MQLTVPTTSPLYHSLVIQSCPVPESNVWLAARHASSHDERDDAAAADVADAAHDAGCQHASEASGCS